MSEKNMKNIQEQVKRTMEKIANMTPEQREAFDRNFNMGASDIDSEEYYDEEDD